MKDNQIYSAGLEALAECVSTGSPRRLTALKLTCNKIGDIGVWALAGATSRDHGALASLKRLYLNSNKIGSTGLANLARAIADGAMPNLERLSLRVNPIGDPGTMALAKAASGSAKMASLIWLDLSDLGGRGGGRAGLQALSTAASDGAPAAKCLTAAIQKVDAEAAALRARAARWE